MSALIEKENGAVESEVAVTPEELHKFRLFRKMIRAHAAGAMAKAQRDGTLPPLSSCADCGEPAIGWDHRDYRNPLAVEPVCKRCNQHRGPARPVLPTHLLHVWEVSRFLTEDVAWFRANTPDHPIVKGRSGKAQRHLEQIKAGVKRGDTLEEIGAAIGITRERVRQLLDDLNLTEQRKQAKREAKRRIQATIVEQAERRALADPLFKRALDALRLAGHDVKWTVSPKGRVRGTVNGTELRVHRIRRCHQMNRGGPLYYHAPLTPTTLNLVLCPDQGALFGPGTEDAYLMARHDPANRQTTTGRVNGLAPLCAWDDFGMLTVPPVRIERTPLPKVPRRRYSSRTRAETTVGVSSNALKRLHGIAGELKAPLRDAITHLLDHYDRTKEHSA